MPTILTTKPGLNNDRGRSIGFQQREGRGAMNKLTREEFVEALIAEQLREIKWTLLWIAVSLFFIAMGTLLAVRAIAMIGTVLL